MPGKTDDTLATIRQIILEEAEKTGVKVEKIILFGSRARGNPRKDSDYDILIIVKEQLDKETRRRLAGRIRRRLAEALIPADIIVAGIEKWKEYKNTIGHLYHAIQEEGIPV